MANPKILGSITLAILVISGFLAMKNKSAYEREIAQAAVEEQHRDTSAARLEELQGQNNQYEADTAKAEQDIASLTEEEDKLKREEFELRDLEKDKADKVAEFQGASEEIAEQEAKFEKVRGVVAKLSALSKEIKELDDAIASSQGDLDKLMAESGEVEKDMLALRELSDGRSQGRSRAELRTAIKSIYPNWGFVTLEGGDTEGVVLNSTLDVVRGVDVIAKLLVTAVEADSSSASIVPDSLAQGEMLMIGDEVVPAGSTQAEEVPAE